MISKEEYLKAKEVVREYEYLNGKPKRLIPNVLPEHRDRLNLGIDRPLSRVVREGSWRFCINCNSTVSRDGFLGIIGEMLCHNDSCENSKSKKIYR